MSALAELAHPCEHCAAAPLTPCLSPTGRTLAWIHLERSRG